MEVLLAGLVGFFVGAITHEMDIIRRLRASGDAGYAAWTGKIVSKEMMAKSEPPTQGRR